MPKRRRTDGRSELVALCESGDVSALCEAISSSKRRAKLLGSDCFAIGGREGVTLLQGAAVLDDASLASALVDIGADADGASLDCSPLVVAVECSSFAVLEVLLRRGSLTFEHHAVAAALSVADTTALQMLLHVGAYASDMAQERAKCAPSLEVVEILAQCCSLSSSLGMRHWFGVVGREEMDGALDFLCSLGIDLNERVLVPSERALFSSDPELRLEALLDHGARLPVVDRVQRFLWQGKSLEDPSRTCRMLSLLLVHGMGCDLLDDSKCASRLAELYKKASFEILSWFIQAGWDLSESPTATGVLCQACKGFCQFADFALGTQRFLQLASAQGLLQKFCSGYKTESQALELISLGVDPRTAVQIPCLLSSECGNTIAPCDCVTLGTSRIGP